VPARPIRLAPAAAEDLRGIQRYTVEQWGHGQWRRYAEDLDALFARLSEHPELGSARGDVRAGLRSIPVGTHVMWYRLGPERLEVVRILHAAMDPTTRL
jgi:toxin ParE1/3/4